MTRFGAIADVHGNRWALEAVLEALETRRVKSIVNLGDNLAGPLDHDGTASLLQRLKLPGVSGNQDRELVEAAAPHSAWLASFPFRLELPGILLFHGTPGRDDVYLLETVTPEGVRLATEAELAQRLGNASHSLMLCGHTHIPRVVRRGDQLIVNPGSVGLQAYVDEQPLPHRMETGSPEARCAILERRENGWKVESLAIPYDWTAAADYAQKNGREDWAHRLKTGRA